MPSEVQIFPVTGMPEVVKGSDLSSLIAGALAEAGRQLQDGDVVVVTHKVVSKAEGRLLDLGDVVPSSVALQFAAESGKDPREVEAVLSQTARVVRMVRGVLIAQTRHGLVCANAGVDRSNVGGSRVCLLPEDPDASAAAVRAGLLRLTGAEVAVIVSDSFGRPWRMGQVNIAIGVSGMRAIHDYRGQRDTQGRELAATALAVADELASAAELVQNKMDKVPVAVIRGYRFPAGEGSARDLVRPLEQDLFI